MNYALILAGGVGQRLRNSGLPKQFIELLGKPIVAYTLEKFEVCSEIEKIVIVCHSGWTEEMRRIVEKFNITKVSEIVIGGGDRQESIKNGLSKIDESCDSGDIVVIHDGVRPLVAETTIRENIRVARKHGNAMTVKAVTETVVVTESEIAKNDNFYNRADTYTLTSPQSFRIKELINAYQQIDESHSQDIPILDASIIYAQLKKDVYLVKEEEQNLKITTPEDFYYFRAILEMEENKYIFGL